MPSTSAGLVYGRAALLGLISGEPNCNTAYPKCPRNEDDLLYYLNNHRGGFFRFFNGGAAFGDSQTYQPDSNPNPNQYQHQYQSSATSNQFYQQSHQRPQQTQQTDDGSVQSNLASLQNIAEAINNSGGINLSNLGANTNLFSGLAGLLNGGGSSSGSGTTSSSSGFDLGNLAANAGLLGNLASLVGGTNQASTPSKAPPDDQGQSLTELVGNLLTGFVGQRFAGRRINKRSIDVDYDDDERNSTDTTRRLNSSERKLPIKVSAFKLKLAASKGKFKFPQEPNEKEIENEEKYDEIESRILNTKPAIYSNDDRYDHRHDGRYENRYDDKFVFNSNDGEKNVHFMNRIIGPNLLKNYPSYSQSHSQVHFDDSSNNDEFRLISNNRSPKLLIKFQGSSEQSNSNSHYNRYHQQNTPDSVRFDETATHRPSKMIFPDRTGTGNLRFDHVEFDNQNSNSNSNRYGKILTYGDRRPQTYVDDGNHRVTFGQTDRYLTNSQQNYRPSSNNNYYQNPNTNSYNQNYPSYNRYTGSSSGSNSNANRQRDDNSSQNIYVTNGEGKTVYYINAHGKKVYV